MRVSVGVQVCVRVSAVQKHALIVRFKNLCVHTMFETDIVVHQSRETAS